MDIFTGITADRFPLVRDMGWNRTDSLYTHPDRILDYHVFLYVAQGAMQVIEEGTEYVVRQHEYVFLEKGLHHWGLPATPESTSWYWIHFNLTEDGSTVYKDHLPLPALDYYYPDYYQYRIPLPKYGKAPAGMEEQLTTVIKLLRHSDSHSMTRSSISVLQLFLDLHTSSAFRQAAVPDSKHSLVEQIMSYLSERLEEPYDAGGLQAHLNMNYSYLSSLFRKSTGYSIVQAHTKLKMNKAVEMMRNSSMTISQISLALGYQNPFYFSRVFKKIIGEPPSAFIRQLYRS